MSTVDVGGIGAVSTSWGEFTQLRFDHVEFDQE